MQPRTRVITLALIAVAAMFVLAGCGGGKTGKTWFNLPSVEVEVNEAGQAKVAGFTLPAPILQAAQVDQLQAAGVQQIEARVGYGGIFPLVNGADLPYLAWDEESAAVVQEAVRTLPGVPMPNLVAGILPRLRTFGLGATIKLPPGAKPVAVARWRGETVLGASEPPADPTIGPLTLESISFSPEGTAYLGSIPLASLGAPLDLPPAITGLLKQLDITTLALQTQPTGLELEVNGGPFPDLRYDQARLDQALKLAGIFLGDSPLLGTINSVAGQLTGADIRAAVSFDGQPVGPLALENLNVRVLDDGSIEAMGIGLPMGSLLSPELLATLSTAGLGNLSINVGEGNLALANDGQPFPRISWTDAGEEMLTSLAPALGLPAGQIGGVLGVAKETGLSLEVALPGADAEPVEVAPLAPVDLGPIASPIIRAELAVDGSGVVTRIGNVATRDLSSFGVPPITLPANVLQILAGTGADKVQVQTQPGHAEIKLDGQTALNLDYDVASLQLLLNTLKPILNSPLLGNENVSTLIDVVLLPMAAGATADISLALP